MYTCPHCDKPGISRVKKLFLGPPAVPSSCKACGKRVGVSLVSTVVEAIILIGVALLSARVDFFLLRAAIWVVSAFLLSAGYLKWARLVPVREGSVTR